MKLVLTFDVAGLDREEIEIGLATTVAEAMDTFDGVEVTVDGVARDELTER